MHKSQYGKRLGETQNSILENCTRLSTLVESKAPKVFDKTHRDPDLKHLFTLESISEFLQELADTLVPVKEKTTKKKASKKVEKKSEKPQASKAETSEEEPESEEESSKESEDSKED